MSDQHYSSSPSAKEPVSTNDLQSNLLSIFSGAGVGLLVGILLGTAVSKTVGLVLGGLASSLALILGLNDRYFTQAKAIRIGTFGFVCVISTLGGMYIRTHQLLAPSYESQKQRYMDLGYQPTEALEMLKYTRSLVPQKGKGDGSGIEIGQAIHAGVLFSAEVELTSCSELDDLDELPSSEVVNNFEMEEGAWREMAQLAVADTDLDAEDTKTFLLAARDGLCDQTPESVSASSCKKLESLRPDVTRNQLSEAFVTSGGIWKPLAQSIGGTDLNTKNQATALRIAKTALCKGN